MQPSSDRVLVTGAAGFLGSHLVQALAESGADVHGLVREEADLRDKDAIRRVIESVRPRVVFHAAAGTGHPDDADARTAFLADTVLGTQNLLEALRPAAGLERLVHVGSSLEYGHSSTPLRETDPLAPVTFRGAAKAAATLLVLQSGLPRNRRAALHRLRPRGASAPPGSRRRGRRPARRADSPDPPRHRARLRLRGRRGGRAPARRGRARGDRRGRERRHRAADDERGARRDARPRARPRPATCVPASTRSARGTRTAGSPTRPRPSGCSDGRPATTWTPGWRACSIRSERAHEPRGQRRRPALPHRRRAARAPPARRRRRSPGARSSSCSWTTPARTARAAPPRRSPRRTSASSRSRCRATWASTRRRSRASPVRGARGRSSSTATSRIRPRRFPSFSTRAARRACRSSSRGGAGATSRAHGFSPRASTSGRSRSWPACRRTPGSSWPSNGASSSAWSRWTAGGARRSSPWSAACASR